MDRRWLSVVLALSACACSDIPVNHDLAEQCGCVTEPVRLSPVGSPVETTTTVAPCRVFTLDVAPIAERAGVSCSMEMTCPSMTTGVTVARAVQDPDVQAAVRAGPMLYGAGPSSPIPGGPVYRIGVGQANFEVGSPCADSNGCTPIPPGVQGLLDVMLAVNSQEVRRSPCREVLNL
jgi:hypothetical protein